MKIMILFLFLKIRRVFFMFLNVFYQIFLPKLRVCNISFVEKSFFSVPRKTPKISYKINKREYYISNSDDKLQINFNLPASEAVQVFSQWSLLFCKGIKNSKLRTINLKRRL